MLNLSNNHYKPPFKTRVFSIKPSDARNTRVLSSYDNHLIINRLRNQHTFSSEISLQTHRLEASNEAFGGSKLSEFRLHRTRFCAPSYNCGAQSEATSSLKWRTAEHKMTHDGVQNGTAWHFIPLNYPLTFSISSTFEVLNFG